MCILTFQAFLSSDVLALLKYECTVRGHCGRSYSFGNLVAVVSVGYANLFVLCVASIFSQNYLSHD